MKILVVDDQETTVDYICRLLRARGHDVEQAYDGKQALDLLLSGKFDLIFSDQDMPELTGVELSKIVKEKFPDTKIIMITGYDALPEDFAKKIGVHEFVRKPIHKAIILDVIKKYEPK